MVLNFAPFSAQHSGPAAGCPDFECLRAPRAGSCPWQSLSVGLGREQAVQSLRFLEPNAEDPAQYSETHMNHP